MREFYEAISEKKNSNPKMNEVTLRKHREGVEDIMRKIKEKQESLYNFSKRKETQNLATPVFFLKDFFNSSILAKSSNQVKINLEFLRECLGKLKTVELLFTASKHKFSSTAFHKHCDDIPDTLVLIRTGGGKTIAGYSHYKWNYFDGFVNDKERRVFLVLMD